MTTVRAWRIIVVSPDPALGHELATALASVGGSVDVHPSLDAVAPGGTRPALCVVHLARELAPAASEPLPGLTCPAIVILPRSGLASVVQLMQSSEHVAGMMIAEELDLGQLAAMASRLLDEDPFGLAKVLAPGAPIHRHTIGDYLEKSTCMARLSEFAEQSGVPRRYRDPIEQCVDEMLMNALYDAPIGEHGEHVFSGVPTRTRITQRTEQTVSLQYASDGTRFAVSVRDAFGSLERPTVLRYLDKCLHAEDQVDRKLGGAGVGLYLMVNSSTAVSFTVISGIATEALCVFDVTAPKLQLEQFGFVQLDAAGRIPTAPARALPGPALPLSPSEVRRRRLVRGGAVMLAALTVVAAIIAWPRLFPPDTRAHVTITTIPSGATIELGGRVVGTTTAGPLAIRDLDAGRAYPVTVRLDGHELKQAVVQPHVGANTVTFELQAIATVELDSNPAGAAVEIDGKPMGSTPLTLTSLVPGATVSVVFTRTGYRPTTETLQVPAAGEVKRLVRPLERSDDFVRVRFVSDPSGAEVVERDQPVTTDRTYTPAEMFVEADKLQRFMLTMPGHVPVVIEPFTPARGADGLEKGGELVEGVSLRLEAASSGKVTVSGAPHCTDVAVPFDCTLAPGSYVVEYLGPDATKITRTVIVAADTLERF